MNFDSKAVVNKLIDLAAWFIGNFLFLISLPLLVLRNGIHRTKQTLGLGKPYEGSNNLVVITGCDTGIGRIAAERFLQLGFTVIAGCLDSASAKASFKPASSRLHVVQLDICKQNEVDRFTHYIRNLMDRSSDMRKDLFSTFSAERFFWTQVCGQLSIMLLVMYFHPLNSLHLNR